MEKTISNTDSIMDEPITAHTEKVIPKEPWVSLHDWMRTKAAYTKRITELEQELEKTGSGYSHFVKRCDELLFEKAQVEQELSEKSGLLESSAEYAQLLDDTIHKLETDVKALVEAAEYELSHGHAGSRAALDEALKPFRSRHDPLTPTEKDIGKICEFWNDDDYRIGKLHAIGIHGAFFCGCGNGTATYWAHARIICDPICQMISHDGSGRQPDEWDSNVGGLILPKGETNPQYSKLIAAHEWVHVKAYLPAKYIKVME